MTYPTNIHMISGDPIHYGHKKTIELAEQRIGVRPTLVICANALKDSGMFSLEERKELAHILLPKHEIHTVDSDDQVRQYIHRAERVIRGIRNEHDREYMKKLIAYYGVMAEMNQKAVLIELPENHRAISSAKTKEFVKENEREKALACTSIDIILRIEEKLGYNLSPQQMS